ncbi:hypothetical protein ACJRO7_020017 [Eucalyptus globulus]|uniref:Uncharacterized protein n=1 Tax=Eucalyptus globulus TaxID=34317 RepID=A0ABD3KL29_EUCGL
MENPRFHGGRRLSLRSPPPESLGPTRRGPRGFLAPCFSAARSVPISAVRRRRRELWIPPPATRPRRRLIAGRRARAGICPYCSDCSWLSFSPSFVIRVVALLVSNFSIPSPMSLPAQCKIVSSSVDIRSSKVCELGLLNYNAKIVFSSSEKRKFRCHYDYYWASVFKVEYKDHLSGQTRLALAEAPNEALAANCRPGIGVNNTYDCWYTSSNSKLSIFHDDFFSCQAKDPSAMEMMRRYYILFFEIFKSWLTGKIRAKYWKWETIVGVITGFSTSLISMSLIKLFQQIKSRHCWTLPCTVSAN